jgi:hypothetical protein
MRKLLVTVLLLGALPLLAINVLPEIPISPAELAPTPYTRDQQIATNGEMYVAVWTDFRMYPLATFAARFRADGALLDPVGIRVAPDSQAGAVIWSGNAFLIAYLRSDGMVTVRALSPDGVLAEPEEAFGSYVLPNIYRMRMATNGDSVLLVTSDATAAVLSLDGHERRQISFPWLFAQRGMAVAAAGSTYLVVAGTEEGRLTTQIVTAEGDLGAKHVLMTAQVWWGADVASDGERFLVAWSHGNLHARFVTGEGAPVEPQIQLTNIQPAFFYSHSVTRLVRRGHEYLLVYRAWEGPPAETMRLANDGENLGPLLAGFSGQVVDVVTDDGGGAVLESNGEHVLTAAFFDGAARPAVLRNRRPVSISGKQQGQVRLARVGEDGIAAAWAVEQRDPALYVSRGPGSNPVLVAAGQARLIDVVVESGTIWVVWTGVEENVYARRFAPDLQPLDPQPVRIAETRDVPIEMSAASGGGAVVVVHNVPLEPYGSEPEGPHIRARILRGTTSGIEVSETGVAREIGFDRLPAIAWSGDAFVVAWANPTGYYTARPTIGTDDRSTPYKPDDRILAVRMTAAGDVLDASPFEIARSKHLVALSAANGTVAWHTYETPDLSSRRHTYAARAVANATVADLGGEDTWFAAFAADGDGFLLTRAKATNETTIVPEILTINSNLEVTSAVPLRPLTVNIIVEEPEARPFDADVIGGPMRMLAYSRIAADGYGHTRRIFLRRLTETSRRRVLR